MDGFKIIARLLPAQEIDKTIVLLPAARKAPEHKAAEVLFVITVRRKLLLWSAIVIVTRTPPNSTVYWYWDSLPRMTAGVDIVTAIYGT